MNNLKKQKFGEKMKKLALLMMISISVFGVDLTNKDITIAPQQEIQKDPILNKYANDPKYFVYKNAKTNDFYLYSDLEGEVLHFKKEKSLKDFEAKIPKTFEGKITTFTIFSPNGYTKEIKTKKAFLQAWNQYIDRFQIEQGKMFAKILTDKDIYFFILDSHLPKKTNCIKCDFVNKKDEERNVITKYLYKIERKK